MGRKSRSTQTIIEAEAQAPLALEVAPENAPAEVPSTPAPVPPAVTRWRVLESRRVSWFGHLTMMPAGEVITLAEYGPEGVVRLREQGVQLEPLA
jgi:hypothetical protein